MLYQKDESALDGAVGRPELFYQLADVIQIVADVLFYYRNELSELLEEELFEVDVSCRNPTARYNF